MPIVRGVDGGSPARRGGVRVGDNLMSINGHAVTDVLDLTFHGYESSVKLTVERNGERLEIAVRKGEGEPLGLEFDTYLIDKPRGCRNKCVFCFIDQMPTGCRDTLYFKDDDARLSFLQGNYITLTNLSDDDVTRICDMRISPLGVSVHTTNPELRCKMLNNRFAGEKLGYLRRFADAGLQINAQIVLCPDWNDGDELERTLSDLCALEVNSLSIVPVGLSRFRQGLTQLRPVGRADALAVLDAAERWGERCLERLGSRVIYCSDEVFLTADVPIPDLDYYEDFPQIENGVGMAATFCDEFRTRLSHLRGDEVADEFSLATGRLFEPILNELVDLLTEKCHNVKGHVYGIDNHFFGETVTVSGLVTGGDLISTLRGKHLGKRLIIPPNMLRAGETVFLDDVTVADVERELGVRVAVADDLMATILEGGM